LGPDYAITRQPTELEDVFIYLMSQSRDNFISVGGGS